MPRHGIDAVSHVHGAERQCCLCQLAELLCGRYVYQKAYIEFFCSPESFQQLRQRLDKAPTVTYMAVNAAGESHMNVQPGDVNAVTWGVFPAKEIMQPTVVDPQSFGIWKVQAGFGRCV